MKKMMLVLSAVSAFVAGARAAVNFTGTGSDVASAANWGDTLPGETEEVNFPAEAIPAGGLTLSAGVNFGATTFAAGYSGRFSTCLRAFWRASGRILPASSSWRAGARFSRTRRWRWRRPPQS